MGGYGAVGSKIARLLRDVQPEDRVIIAGRSLEKARRAAEPLGMEARAVDLSNSAGWAVALTGVDVVIACIDQTSTDFVEMLASRGIAYVDVTAGDDFFRKVEALALPSPVVLSVGLAPGLSNLLAVRAADALDMVEAVDIGLLMGTGDEHGSAAIAWSTARMFDPEAPRDDRVVDFGAEFGRRTAYFMDFADQHVLARTMGWPSVTTRVTYDSRFLAAALFWTGRTFAGNRTMETLVRKISHMPTLGSDKCVLSVTARGSVANAPAERTAFFHGRREASVTAAMAVAITQEALASRVGPGVHHAHMLELGDTVFQRLEDWGQSKFTLP